MSDLLLSEVAESFRSVVGSLPLGRHRRWRRLELGVSYEVWAIAWPHHTGLLWHDHGTSGCGVYVVQGMLRERYLLNGVPEVRHWATGDHVDLPTGHAHEVVNEGRQEAISIHVYSPRLADTAFRVEGEVNPLNYGWGDEWENDRLWERDLAS